MSLDEYRAQLIERLKSCTDTAAARTLLAEADLRLMNARLTALTRSKFWESLQEELAAVVEAPRLSADRAGSPKLEAVIAAAQARLTRYRECLAEALDKPL